MVKRTFIALLYSKVLNLDWTRRKPSLKVPTEVFYYDVNSSYFN